MSDGGTTVIVHQHIGRDGVIVELRPGDHDTPAERDMEHLTREDARDLRDQLNDYLDDHPVDERDVNEAKYRFEKAWAMLDDFQAVANAQAAISQGYNALGGDARKLRDGSYKEKHE